MHEHALRRLRLEGALRQAADRSELALLFQPIVALASEQLAGFEALVRWRRNGVLVPPADFIPVAEETGVIRSIGGQVLRDACRQAAAWQERRPAHPGAAVSVNISPRQLADPHMVASVARALEETGADPARLRLELTETALMADHHAAVRTCNELTALGVSLVLDDFGTGFSSLSHLGRYPHRHGQDRPVLRRRPDRRPGRPGHRRRRPDDGRRLRRARRRRGASSTPSRRACCGRWAATWPRAISSAGPSRSRTPGPGSTPAPPSPRPDPPAAQIGGRLESRRARRPPVHRGQEPAMEEKPTFMATLSPSA
jgi:hypothetical protein